MSGFFHGISVTEVTIGGVTVEIVNSAVIGLVGSAPQWLAPQGSGPGINKPTLVLTQAQAAAFGQAVQGYTIPYALNAMQEQGAGAIVVIDVFNPNTHSSAVAAKSVIGPAVITGAGAPVFLGHMGLVGPPLPNYTIAATTVVVKDSTDAITYVEGTDYTIDYVNGLLYAKAGTTMTASETLHVSYSYCDPSKVLAASIVGTVTGTPPVYTGIQALQTTFATMGFYAKLLCTPGYTDDTTAVALLAMANTIRAIPFVDCPPQTAASVAVSNRGVAGNAFNLASDRLVLCAPELYMTDFGINPTGVTVSPQGVVQWSYGSSTIESPMSAWVCGATSASDLQNGFWFSPSNKPIIGPLGPDISMYMSAFDANSDTNTLNAAGIMTVFNGFGTGLRTWGNRASSFPASGNVTTFIAIRRTLDVVEQSIQFSSLPFLDQPITNGLINTVLNAVNAFLRSLIQQGALLPGSLVTYNPADNPVQNLQNGIVTFDISLMPPPPAEQISYKFYVNPALLANLGASVTTQSTQQSVNPSA